MPQIKNKVQKYMLMKRIERKEKEKEKYAVYLCRITGNAISLASS